MRKWSLLVVLFGLVFFPGVVFAHTDLKEASPAENAMMRSEVNDVTLDFNTRIGSISTMTVSDEGGKTIKFATLEVKEKRMIGQFSTPLKNGQYTVQWRIAGLDGHIIERSYGFEVNAPAKVTKVEPTSANSSELNDEIGSNSSKIESNASKIESNAQQPDRLANEEGFSSGMWLFMGGLIVLIGIIGYLVGKKNKSRSDT